MIGTFRKHSQGMWWIIIVVIIITFVFWGSSTSRNSGGARSGDGNYGVMNGEVITPALLEQTRREVRLGYAYNYFYQSGGRWPGAGENLPGQDLDQRSYQRLFLIQKTEAHGIQVSDEAVIRTANARMRDLARGKEVAATDFEREVLARDKLNLADFERFIRHEIAIQELVKLIGAGGELVTPAEVDALYRQQFQPVSAQALFFRATNDLTTIPVTAEALGEFYTNRLAAYRLPDRVQISYVSYPLSNFLAEARTELAENTNLNEFIEVRYEQLGAEAFPDAKTPAEAKQKIREEFERNMAMDRAAKQANTFDHALYDKTVTNYSAAAFAAAAAELGLTAQVSAPFAVSATPAGLDVNEDFVRRAFSLTREDPLTEPLAGKDHVYVIGYNRQLPSEVPALDTIRERVTSDYRFVQAATAAQKAGMEFHTLATNSLATGKTFADVCATAGLKPISLAPFSPASRSIPEIANQVREDEFKQAVFTTTPGQVTPLMRSADGAVLAFVAERLPVDESAMQTNLPAFTREVQQMRRSEVFDEWWRVEAPKAFAKIPFFQKQQELSAAGN